MPRRVGGPSSYAAEREAAYAQLNDDASLAEAWAHWSAGGVVHCAADGASIALTVDATVATYRMMCSACGNASPWFEVSGGALQTRLSGHIKTERPGVPDP